MYTGNEREALCDLLLRFLENTDEYDPGDEKYLTRLVKRVREHGSSTLRNPQDREAFTDLIHLATC